MRSVVVRTFAWIVILGRQGILNKTLAALGLVDEPLRLLFSETGVVLVLRLVEQGEIRLTDPVTCYLPDFRPRLAWSIALLTRIPPE